MKGFARVAIAAAAALVGAGTATAGEDSTDHWGAGGTGAAYYATQCGLQRFPGPVSDADAQRPCGATLVASDEQTAAGASAPPRAPAWASEKADEGGEKGAKAGAGGR